MEMIGSYWTTFFFSFSVFISTRIIIVHLLFLKALFCFFFLCQHVHQISKLNHPHGIILGLINFSKPLDTSSPEDNASNSFWLLVAMIIQHPIRTVPRNISPVVIFLFHLPHTSTMVKMSHALHDESENQTLLAP